MMLERSHILGVATVSAALLCGSATAHAESCGTATRRHNELNAKHTNWWIAAARATFGVEPRQIDSSKPDYCEKWLPLARQREQKAQELVQTWDAMAGACPRLRANVGPRPDKLSTVTNARLLEMIQNEIRACENKLVASKPVPAPAMESEKSSAKSESQSAVANEPEANCSRAETHWKSAEDMKAVNVYEDHLARFPNCEFASLARARIKALRHGPDSKLGE
jgi:hypothetical protein